MSSPKYPVWNGPKKILAREQTIILAYRDLFQRQSAPEDKQYWTMSGKYSKGDIPIEGEFHQLEKAGLIKANQFHAIDIDENIINKNREHYPELNWHLGDFLETMKDYSLTNNFNPAIINCDNVRLPEKGIKYLSSIIMFVDHNVEGEIMLINNLMLNSPYRKTIMATGEDMLSMLFDNDYFTLSNRWEVLPYCYKYHGTGKRANTWMGSLIFVRK